MNVNLFYQELFEYTLGLDVMGLTGSYTELVKMIDRKTLMTFGNLIPAHYLTYLDLSDSSHIVKKEHQTLGVEYYIDDPVLDKFNLPILALESVEYNNISSVDPYDPNSTAYHNSLLTSRGNITLESVLFGSEYTRNRTLLESTIPYKRYKELRGPRTIYLKNWGYQGTVEIRLKTRWPNIASIPEEYRDVLMTLAKFDVKIKLWNELRYMEDVVTPNGNLNLRISNWESAEQDREEWIRDFRVKSFPDRVGASYFYVL